MLFQTLSVYIDLLILAKEGGNEVFDTFSNDFAQDRSFFMLKVK